MNVKETVLLKDSSEERENEDYLQDLSETDWEQRELSEATYRTESTPSAGLIYTSVFNTLRADRNSFLWLFLAFKTHCFRDP